MKLKLTFEEREMLAGKQGKAVQKSMEILTALGEIFGAEELVPVASVQVAGVSYSNLGEAGLEYLNELAEDGRVKVFTTLNPAGMDLENWQALGISSDFAEKQERVIKAFAAMGVITTCTCTPYFVGNVPHYGQHIAWAESSAVSYANSVLGAKTNREGGPSALAAALTGRTPKFGLHLEENRQAQYLVEVKTEINNEFDFGALGYAIGLKLKNKIPLITGVKKASNEELKSFCASIATYGGTALFHMEGITPNKTERPAEKMEVVEEDLKEAKNFLNDASVEEVDLVAIGCPHCSLNEIREIARMLKGQRVKKETWVCVARPVKKMADAAGYSKILEEAGVKYACDTCIVVAPIKGRFKALATNSAKAVFYCRGRHKFKTLFTNLEGLVKVALS